MLGRIKEFLSDSYEIDLEFDRVPPAKIASTLRILGYKFYAGVGVERDGEFHCEYRRSEDTESLHLMGNAWEGICSLVKEEGI